MNTKLQKEQDVIQEAVQILSEHMEASKLALVVSLLQGSQSDYLDIREKLFGDETVDSLIYEVEAYENMP